MKSWKWPVFLTSFLFNSNLAPGDMVLTSELKKKTKQCDRFMKADSEVHSISAVYFILFFWFLNFIIYPHHAIEDIVHP